MIRLKLPPEMRDGVLCRAKRLDNGKWATGYYTQTPVVDIRNLAELGDPMPDAVADYITVLNVRQHRDRVSGQTLETIVREDHRVDPKTLCRYSGLKDRKGGLIFEHDFIRCTRTVGGLKKYALDKWGLVQERYGAFGIIQNYQSLESWQVPYVFRPFKGWLEEYEYKVVGNKFDNPTMWQRFTKAGGQGLRYE